MDESVQTINRSAPPLLAIVDDDDAVCAGLESWMRSVGYRATHFASAEEFLVASLLEKISCLIADVKLRGMSGLSLQAHLAAANRHIPIIFITAHWDEAIRIDAIRLGAVAFLRKPCSETELLDAIDLALKARPERAGDPL